MAKNKLPSSFRDPSGFVFEKDGILNRQINKSYQENFDAFIESGLYKKLVQENLLIPHKEVSLDLKQTSQAYKIIQPTKIPFISYPYEWSFTQLKDAALATLKIQKLALEHQMNLKDASAFNIQFFEGKPIFIDSLSFEKYKDGEPWVAYKQFCQHFLAPLALMSYTDARLNNLSKIFIDGAPLDLVVKLLPTKTKFNLSLLMHLHMHASSQKKYASQTVKKEAIRRSMSKRALLGLIDNLESVVKNLKWKPEGTEWADYYPANNNYVTGALKEKAKLVEEFVKKVKPKSVWDLGGNTGLFSRIASNQKIFTVSFDIDPAAVELNYKEAREKGEEYILPLVSDLTNPTPGLGWKNEERDSLVKRGPTDLALALAIVHHLAISNNLPLEELALFFSQLSNKLIIEFVPKEDSQVQKLLTTREDIFPDYTKEGFEKAFSEFFKIEKTTLVPKTKRFLYLMTKKS